MNRKRYISWFQKGVAYTLLGIVMFASCGISYNLHFCHNSLASTTFYPGLTQSTGCGCESSLKPNKLYFSDQNSVIIHKTGCCRNLSFYSKLSATSFNELIQGFNVFPCDLTLEILPGFSKSTASPAEKTPILPIHHPPPLSGKLLVYTLHQLRIPSFSGDCC
jgi:hypothetical protein